MNRMDPFPSSPQRFRQRVETREEDIERIVENEEFERELK